MRSKCDRYAIDRSVGPTTEDDLNPRSGSPASVNGQIALVLLGSCSRTPTLIQPLCLSVSRPLGYMSKEAREELRDACHEGAEQRKPRVPTKCERCNSDIGYFKLQVGINQHPGEWWAVVSLTRVHDGWS